MLSGDTSVAAHYGSPFVEQRRLEAGDAFVDLSHRGVLRVGGPDRLSWLDSMTSQRLSSLNPGSSAESLLLDPQGRIEHVLRLVDDGEQTWIFVDEGRADSLAAYLTRMRFALRVEVEDLSNSFVTIGFMLGGDVETVLTAVGQDHPIPLWRDPWHTVASGGWQYASEPHPGEAWRYAEAALNHEQAAALADRAEAGEVGLAGLLALDALRVVAWRPSQHAEVDDRALPHEFDWLRSSVHLNKGCYRGQETVAKVHNLGHPPRRLAQLHLDGSDAVLPNAGDLVYVTGDEKPVGRVTTAARHMEWGAVALALLKRSVPADAALEVSCDEIRIPATQQVIVPPEAGATRAVPKLPRL